MINTSSSDRVHDWEVLLKPGVCWFIWDDDGTLVFSSPCERITSIITENMPVESIFPPDIAYLIHEMYRDGSELSLGAGKKIRLTIPGTDLVWPGSISRLSNGRFSLIWAEKEDVKPEPESGSAIVRHDITNLIMGIGGYIDIIDEIVDDEEVRLLLRKSRDLGERIRRVAELTRTYQDLGIRPPGFIEAESSITKILERYEFSEMVTSDVNVTGLFIYVDRMFDAIIYEIVRNSLQYGGKGVHISFSFRKDPEGLVLIIEDSGPGIEPDLKERIFSRNYADRRGYGLYLAAEILDITGISIRETGTFGEGARFEMIFPPDTYRFGN
jgi:signal transduction histidine kinase